MLLVLIAAGVSLLPSHLSRLIEPNTHTFMSVFLYLYSRKLEFTQAPLILIQHQRAGLLPLSMFPAPLLGSEKLGSHCAQSVSLLVTSPLSLILGTQLPVLFECRVAILLALSSHAWSIHVLNVIFTGFKWR